MSGLIKNEIIKTYKSGFIKAALCIILALCVIIPVGSRLIKQKNEISQDNYYSDSIEKTDNHIEKALLTAYDDTEKFFSENGMNYDDWRQNYYSNSLLSLNILAQACGLASEGCSQSEAESFFTSEEMNTSVYFDERHNVVFSEDDYKNAFELKENELSVAKKNIDKMISELKDFIGKATVSEMYAEDAEFYKSELSDAQFALKTAEAELKKSPENSRLIYARDLAEGSLKEAELNLWGAEYLKNNECEYNSWQYSAVRDILMMNVSSAYTQTVPMDEKLYLSSDEAYFNTDYKSYLKSAEGYRSSAEETEKIVKYALENNIPLPECTTDSVRSSFESDTGFAAVLVSILMVAVAAITMFSEYSTGSIRLLLIRPKSRSKILLSKLLTVIIYGAAAMAASMAVLLVLDMLLHSGRDMSVPYLLVGSDGEVKEIAPIVYILVRVILKLFSAFVIISAVFLISSVFTKGGIIALAVGSAGVCSVSVASSMALAFNSNFKGLFSYTVLPYLDLSCYFGNYVSTFRMNDGSFIGDMYDLSMLRTEFDPRIGAVIAAVHIALFIGLAFYGFNKKQIKN